MKFLLLNIVWIRHGHIVKFSLSCAVFISRLLSHPNPILTPQKEKNNNNKYQTTRRWVTNQWLQIKKLEFLKNLKSKCLIFWNSKLWILKQTQTEAKFNTKWQNSQIWSRKNWKPDKTKLKILNWHLKSKN